MARVRVRVRVRVRRGGELLSDEVQAEAVVHQPMDLLVARRLHLSTVAQHRDKLWVVRVRVRSRVRAFLTRAAGC